MGSTSELPPPSPEQSVVLGDIQSGMNVVCSACAGAGKSTLMCHAALLFEEPTLILAYNKQLADDMSAKIAVHAPASKCCTFHALCSSVLGITPDDDALYDRVATAESSGVSECAEPHVLAQYRQLFIDEAQDLKDIHIRLIRLVVKNARQMLVVGDEPQLLYDYDPDDAASVKFMKHPGHHFAGLLSEEGTWKQTRLSWSFRLTHKTAAVANALLDCSYPRVCGMNKANEDPVYVYTTSAYKYYEALKDAGELHRYRPCQMMIVVPRMAHNNALRVLVNALSADGVPVHIHGVDSVDANASKHKLRVCTYHAAKGSEADMVIVLGIGTPASHNARHVALTRGKLRTVILQDNRCRDRDLCLALPRLIEEGLVVVDSATNRAVQHESKGVSPASVDDPAPVQRRQIVRDIAGWVPRGRGTDIRDLLHVSTCKTDDAAVDFDVNLTLSLGGRDEDVEQVFNLAVRMCAEYIRSGVVPSRISALFDTRKVSRAFMEQSVIGGSQETLPTSYPNQLLHPHLRQVAKLAWANIRGGMVRDACKWISVSAATLAWGSFQHRMRQILPVDWAHQAVFDARVDAWLSREGYMGPRVGILADADTYLYADAPLLTPRSVSTLVFKEHTTSRDVVEAGILLAMCPDGCDESHILNRSTQTCTTVRLSGSKRDVADLIVSRIRWFEKT